MTIGQAVPSSNADWNHQGRYGEAFVSSIAVAAGFEVYRTAGTGQGVDLHVYQPSANLLGTPMPSRSIYFQVKSWSVGILGSDSMFTTSWP